MSFVTDEELIKVIEKLRNGDAKVKEATMRMLHLKVRKGLAAEANPERRSTILRKFQIVMKFLNQKDMKSGNTPAGLPKQKCKCNEKRCHDVLDGQDTLPNVQEKLRKLTLVRSENDNMLKAYYEMLLLPGTTWYSCKRNLSDVSDEDFRKEAEIILNVVDLSTTKMKHMLQLMEMIFSVEIGQDRRESIRNIIRDCASTAQT